ncbi:DUF2975 domain-containing protein [Segatella paludivivens]|uniref:DUF2975 domain-containing protein n=1 Tax=Segatella paludivivens TaxID=185294 RepID=UPI00036B20E2|nr:DUF2975 domain-containing protein [Segatella paludivivens]
MKRKFNIYCILLLLAIAFGFCLNIYHNADDIALGFKDANHSVEAQESFDEGKTNMKQISYINLKAKNDNKFLTAVKNNVTGQMDSIQVGRVRIATSAGNNGHTLLSLIIETFTVPLYLCCAIGFWVIFIKIILAVNKGKAFDKKTDWKIKLMGIFSIGLYLAEWGLTCVNYLESSKMYKISGYDISFNHYPSCYLLYLGIGMLIISQLLTIGRKIKEEQELTI